MKLEAEWSKYVTTRLRNAAWFVQRIESGTTGRGIPDIFVVSPDNKAFWIENKILPGIPEDKLALGAPVKIKLPYRPGQISWHEQVYLATPVITLTGIVNSNKCMVTKFTPRLSLLRGYATAVNATVREKCSFDTVVINKCDLLLALEAAIK